MPLLTPPTTSIEMQPAATGGFDGSRGSVCGVDGSRGSVSGVDGHGGRVDGCVDGCVVDVGTCVRAHAHDADGVRPGGRLDDSTTDTTATTACWERLRVSTTHRRRNPFFPFYYGVVVWGIACVGGVMTFVGTSGGVA